MGLSLSTSWNAFRYKNANKLLFEIKKLGFKEVELSFNLTASMVRQAKNEVDSNKIKISSIHNYCPIPKEFSRLSALPDCFSMASTDDKQRELAVKYSKRSIDTAKSLKAKAVVLHCGRVEIPDRTRKLISLYNLGQRKSKAFNELKKEVIKERSAQSKPFLYNALKSLEELNVHAKKSGILLGVETRFYYREMPSFNEIGIILKEFKNSNIFYWHDTGHAQLMENLGFWRHKDYLDAYGKELLGIHIHDISGCQDHLAPLKGDLNFLRFKPFLKKETIKVIEAHHPATADDLIKAKAFLEGAFHGII
ncbi:MAG: sugar phosphate isomerase/epimerase [Candidatus Omnitrophica bacterium]|nr:sugar phosphate isomerase/epimerase [Candidatus Omnitrophota bacterium]